MAAEDFERPKFVMDADYRAPLSDFDPDATPLDVIEPKDYVLAEPTALTDFRERVDDLQFQVEVLKARMAAIGSGKVRLGRAATTWADKSAHAQLGSYPWAKLSGAFVATFVVTRLLRALPLGSMASVAVPLILRQSAPRGRGRRR